MEAKRTSVGRRLLFVVKNLYTMERLGVMYLSSLARSQGWETDLAISDDSSYGDLLERIRRSRPDILGFSVMSPEYPALQDLARRLRRDTGCFLLFGGPHPTFSPEMASQPFVDAILIGEGDISFPAFLERFAEGGDYTQVEGMHFHVDGAVIRNPPAPLVEDLDRIPFPDRELMSRGTRLHREYRSHIFFASRGCPYRCSYCFNHKYNALFCNHGRILRRRSVDNFMEEVRLTKSRYGTSFAYIDDDIFTLCDTAWLEDFAERFPREVGIPFYCNVHVKTVTEEKIRLLQKAGCRVVCFGIETGDETVSRDLLRRDISNREFLRVSGLLHRYGIRFITQNMLALPVEHPLEIDRRTLDLNLRCRPDLALSQLFFPLPGTDLTAYSEQSGHLAPGGPVPDRTNSFSALAFDDPAEKRRDERLQKLFGLIVAFPFLRPLEPFLTRLPLDRFYAFLYAAWVGFTMRFRLEGNRKSRTEVLFFLKSLLGSSLLRRR